MMQKLQVEIRADSINSWWNIDRAPYMASINLATISTIDVIEAMDAIEVKTIQHACAIHSKRR